MCPNYHLVPLLIKTKNTHLKLSKRKILNEYERGELTTIYFGDFWIQGIKTWGPFLEGPEKFSGPESHNKNLKP